MKFCLHSWQSDNRKPYSEKMLKENEHGKFVQNLHPEICPKCGKTRYYSGTKEWVWNGEKSWSERMNEMREARLKWENRNITPKT